MTSPSQPPVFTSAGEASLAAGTAGSLTITATGATTIAQSGTLPAGLSFTDNGNGTATLSGTPQGPDGTFSLTFTGTNASGPTAQPFLLTIGPPLFLSAPQAVFTVGTAGTFTISVSGDPTLRTGILPPGLEFTDHGGGTAIIAGTPAPTTAGITQLSITATSTGGTTTQAFSLMIGGSTVPAFTSAGQGSLAAGVAGSLSITAPGALSMSTSSTLPAGLTFTDNGNGTATLAGTPASANGTSVLTFSATNQIGTATQTFDLTIGPPLFLSAPQAVFTVGTAGTFTISVSGDPTLRTGILPPGLEFTDHGGGTAIIAGTPAPTTAGITQLSITATSTGGTTTQAFSLMIGGSTVPAFTSAGQGSLAAGVAGSLSITAPGALSMSTSSTLPAGLTFTDNGNGTATLAGTPASANGTSVLTFSATNQIGTATQTFDLTIGPPLFLSAPQAVFTVGTAGTFTISVSGDPTLKTGILPPGLEFTDHGGGTAIIAGTPAPTTAGITQLSITATSTGGTTTQAFSLMISGSSVPEISSAGQAAFTSNVFTVTAPGALSITLSGTLPAGVQFTDQGGGTAVISGTPAATAANGSYPLTLTATNAVGSSTQSFNLTVS